MFATENACSSACTGNALQSEIPVCWQFIPLFPRENRYFKGKILIFQKRLYLYWKSHVILTLNGTLINTYSYCRSRSSRSSYKLKQENKINKKYLLFLNLKKLFRSHLLGHVLIPAFIRQRFLTKCCFYDKRYFDRFYLMF